MTDIQTTTAGSLPRTQALIEANAARTFADDGFTLQSTPEFEQLVADAVDDVVERQREAGITLVGDGEFGKAMSNAVDYGAWWSYSFQRAAGLSMTEVNAFNEPPVRSEPGHIRLTSFLDRRDRQLFPDVYAESVEVGRNATGFPTTTGPITYRGQEAVASDIRHLKASLREGEQGFLTAIAPGSAARVRNEYYATDEEHIWAWADALREEYRAIVDAGLILQLDDPSLAENFDQINPEPSIADYQAFTKIRIDAINHAIAGLPKEQVRLHLCWGSWHGPHTTDIELRHILPVVLGANVGSISFEAGNVRHEHEHTVWGEVAVPDDLVLVPGVVSHATNVVEHPDLVAQRIGRFADIVGADRVIASTDCGLGGRIHPDLAWAKLASLGEGARRAAARA
ncbi:cobalamin-independent methionine synthase II family protein [Microbacterium sp. zg.Y1090]|uniref:cobalamin-independent methionine synthase II family protein n=1 Tax=Microbacterium TaxID=33882 RepID=UPI00214ADDD9|nr:MULTISPECIES: cobalamin-independent methionine synthase II family protein [unclassified Microbacterium]MCR2813224.1 cobalamin-independent methionine synthase II family protein [Microbacterium sp. zg.Y1084]MCR2819537.1 cobalamin-independent methionine synthase II family protein [Microbacterium sp. zg.Y1090]MDL5487391.1 cobalamin-independent methionine synthase II family protein [Microbacterium sp. zg-Y1211]WIM28507.1 cobalamin-independent methionine synthase II family protein [Microbacterium 